MSKEKLLNKIEQFSKEISSKNNEPSWLLKHRLNALKVLNEIKPPKIERLDYSSWNLWEISSEMEVITDRVIALDYIKVPENKEVIITNFNNAMNESESKFNEGFLKSNFPKMIDLFDAYTSAFRTDSIFIYIPENAQVKRPIELTFNMDKDEVNREVLIYADKNSSVEIIEKYFSHEISGAAKTNIHIEIVAEDNAKIQYTSLDQLNKNVSGFIRRRAKLQNDSVVNWALGAMNDGKIIEDVKVDLDGIGSESEVKVVGITYGQQTQVINVNIINGNRNTIGYINQRGVALDHSTLTFNGIGHILNGSKGSDAQQESRVLILSDDARADANPILLIDEFEVQAGHAASISRVDQEQLYYLMSRGLSEIQAEKLIIRGFLGIILSEISVVDVREELIATIERKLEEYGK